MVSEIDLLLRGAAIGTAVLVFMVLLMRADSRRKALPVGLLVVSLVGHMILPVVCGPDMTWQVCGTWLIPARLFPVAVTWFVLEIFLEWQQPRSVSVALLLGSGWVSGTWIFHETGLLCIVSATALYIALLVLAIRSARGDLVESRRVFRPAFVAAVAVFGVIRTLAEGYVNDAPIPARLDLTFSLTILAFVVVFAIWALYPGREIWAKATPKPLTRLEDVPPADRLTLQRIEAAMAGELWRREGLTIGGMADQIGVPEHRLRRAINKDLGYRNFSAFVNGYRIDAAKAALAEPENAQRTILEIAFDCGFASLAPFNRAFRARTGTSPRNFRRNLVGQDASFPA